MTLLKSWCFSLAIIGVVVGILGALAAPMAIPFLLGETWWSFALMGVVLVFVVSFITALGAWIVEG